MYLLRKVRGPRWDRVDPNDPSVIVRAAEDLILRQGEDGLSVSQVTVEEDDARAVAMRWISVHQDSLDRALDFMLIPESLIPAGALVTTSDGSGDLLLEERHREIKYAGTFTRETLAADILRLGCRPMRIPMKDLQVIAAQRSRDA